MTSSQVQTDDVVAARELLRDVISPTPVLRSRVLSELVGGPVFLKCENLQRTGSFKLRGAYLRIARLTDAERARLVTDVALIELRGGEHAMLWRAGLWHRVAADFCRGSFGMPVETGAVTAFQAADGNRSRTVL